MEEEEEEEKVEKDDEDEEDAYEDEYEGEDKDSRELVIFNANSVIIKKVFFFKLNVKMIKMK